MIPRASSLAHIQCAILQILYVMHISYLTRFYFVNISYLMTVTIGIHGNDNSNIKIAAVEFRDFEVAAVALNNVDNLVSMILYLILPCVVVPCTD